MAGPWNPAAVSQGLRNYVGGQFSLDPQPEQSYTEMAGDAALGFIPGVGQAMALRDMERARRAQDPVAGGLAAASLVPWGRMAKALRGPGAELIAGKAAKNAPVGTLPDAERLAKEGQDTWDTGWYQGTEKSKPWKWEIDDSKSKMITKPGQGYGPNQAHFDYEGKLSEHFDHPELYKNYPDLANMRVHAYIMPGTPETQMAKYVPGRHPRIEAIANDEKELRRLLLHEIQHGIQAKERGFEKGSSNLGIESGLQQARELFSTTPHTGDPAFAEKHYLHNKGEVEARTTELRRDYTPEQRKAVKPLDMERPLEDRVSTLDTVNAIINRAAGGKLSPEDQAILPSLVKLVRGWID